MYITIVDKKTGRILYSQDDEGNINAEDIKVIQSDDPVAVIQHAEDYYYYEKDVQLH